MCDSSFHLNTQRPQQGFNWPNFNIAVSWGIGRPEERERDGGQAGWPSSRNTHHVYQLSSLSYPYGEPQGSSGFENSYWPQIAEVHIKGMISVRPDSSIFSNIEKH